MSRSPPNTKHTQHKTVLGERSSPPRPPGGRTPPTGGGTYPTSGDDDGIVIYYLFELLRDIAAALGWDRTVPHNDPRFDSLWSGYGAKDSPRMYLRSINTKKGILDFVLYGCYGSSNTDDWIVVLACKDRKTEWNDDRYDPDDATTLANRDSVSYYRLPLQPTNVPYYATGKVKEWIQSYKRFYFGGDSEF